MKHFPDSSEAENPQASAFADCQGHELPASRIPLSAALYWAPAAADAEGSHRPHPHLEHRAPSSIPHTCLGRPDTPKAWDPGSLSPGCYLLV